MPPSAQGIDGQPGALALEPFRLGRVASGFRRGDPPRQRLQLRPGLRRRRPRRPHAVVAQETPSKPVVHGQYGFPSSVSPAGTNAAGKARAVIASHSPASSSACARISATRSGV